MLNNASIVFYNTELKISNNMVTIKNYDKTQAFGYKARHQEGQPATKSDIDIENERYERFLKSARRAKATVFDLVACNTDIHRDFRGKKQTAKFLTLTFKENVTDVSAANKEFTDFMKRLSYQAYGVRKNVIKYIVVPEMQSRGAWHFHVILLNMKYVPWEDLLSIWGQGGIYINALNCADDGTSVAKYITKYISKAIASHREDAFDDYLLYKKAGLIGKKRFFSSRGLKKPWIMKFESKSAIFRDIAHFLIQSRSKGSTPHVRTYENEYRGTVQILSVELVNDALPIIKGIASTLFNDTIDSFKQQSCINWKKLKEIVSRQRERDIIDDIFYRRIVFS